MALVACRTSVCRPNGYRFAHVATCSTRRLSVSVRAVEEQPAEVVGKVALVDKIAKDADITKVQATKALESLINSVQDAVSAGQKVMFFNFGSFEARVRQARSGRNPRTGDVIVIPEAKVPVFKAATAFKAKINGTASPVKAKPAAPTPASPKPVVPALKKGAPLPVAPTRAVPPPAAATKKSATPQFKGKK